MASIILVWLPCCLALLVSYRWPAAGFGCRSMSLALYMSAQLILILLHTIDTIRPSSPSLRALIWLLLPYALLLSFLSAVGGPILQLTGVYVNVYCVAGISSFINPDDPNWTLEVATDTLQMRKLARYRWRYTGVAGLGFLCVVCAAAWFYRNNVHKRCARAIEEVQTIPTPAPEPVQRSRFRSNRSSTHSRISNLGSHYSRRSYGIELLSRGQDIRPDSSPSASAAHVHDVPRWGHG